MAKRSRPTFEKSKSGYVGPATPLGLLNPKTTENAPRVQAQPPIPMSPSMITAIRNSKKGQVPPGLKKYMASRKAKGGK